MFPSAPSRRGPAEQPASAVCRLATALALALAAVGCGDTDEGQATPVLSGRALRSEVSRAIDESDASAGWEVKLRERWFPLVVRAEKYSKSGEDLANILLARLALDDVAGEWCDYASTATRLLESAPTSEHLEPLLSQGGFETAAELCPDFLANHSEGRFLRAADVVRAATARFPKSKSHLLSLVVEMKLAMKGGAPDRARSIREEVLTLAPNSPEADRATSIAWEAEFLRPGAELPAQTWTDISGRGFSLSTVQGRWVVLYAWSADCPVCASVWSELQSISKDPQLSKATTLVGLNYDMAGPRALEAARKHASIGTQVAMSNQPMAARYPIAGVPRVVLLDSKGRVINGDLAIDGLYKEVKKQVMDGQR